MSFGTEKSDFEQLCEILDRDNLTENQVKLLVADILVGDVRLDEYLDLKDTTLSIRILRNAQKVIEHANTVMK